MEGINMEMGSAQTGFATSALKGSLSTQQSSVSALLNGAGKNMATANIPQEGDSARASMMQAEGYGQKLDLMA